MALTGAQVKQLRSMAHHLNPAIIIGKSDVNEGTVEQTVAYLEKHELVKCSVLDGSSLSAREAAEELAERVGDAMSRLPFSRGFCACEELEMRTDYDYLARSPRWYALYRLKTYQPKEG